MRAAIVLGVLLLAAVVGGGAALIIRAQTDDSGAELRLSARRLDDGRVELGLQRRSADGWGARILPDGRFLSLNVPNNEWLNSAAFALAELGGAAAPGASSGALATAEQAVPDEEAEQGAPAETVEAEADGSAAAAQPDQAADDEGEGSAAEAGGEEGAEGESRAVEPEGGVDDAEEGVGEGPAVASDGGGAFDAPVDLIIDAVNDARAIRAAAPPPSYAVYLVRVGDTPSGIALAHGVSLARLLEVNGLSPATLIYPGNELRIPVGTEQVPLGRVIGVAVSDAGDALPYIPIEAPFEAIGGVVYGTIRDQRSGVVHSAVLTASDNGARLVVSCSEGRLVAFVRPPAGLPALGVDGQASLGVYYHLDDGRLRGDRWGVGGERLLVAPDAAGLMAELGGSGRISLRIGGGADAVNVGFAIAGLLSTPIQPNLDRCGAPAPALGGAGD